MITHTDAQRDAASRTAPIALKNKRFYHAGKGHIYKVIGHAFDAERGRWMILYTQLDADGDPQGQTYCHLPEDFERNGRFQEVKF